METFEKLDVWKLAKMLALDVYRALRQCRDFSFRDQMQRSAISIPCNIAEGVERNSQAELRSFLGVAKGSAGELRTQIIIAKDLDYLEGEAFERLMETSVRVSQMLGGLIRSIETGSLPGRPKIPNPRSS
jgi:four helix bundle protein